MNRAAAWLLVLFLMGCSRSPEGLARSHVARGADQERQGRLEGARVDYLAALGAQPKDEAALAALARVSLALGQTHACGHYLELLVASHPKNAEAAVDLARLYLAMGLHEKGLAAAEKALAANQGHHEAGRLRVRALSSLGKPREAMMEGERLASAQNGEEQDFLEASHAAYVASEPGRALAVLEMGLGRYPRSSALLVARSNVLRSTGDPAGAESALRAAVEQDPNRPEIHGIWAEFLVGTGREAEALSYLTAQRARFVSDTERQGQYALVEGRVRARAGDLQGAKTVLYEATSRQPGPAKLLASLGEVLLLEGDRAQAFEVVKRLRKLEPQGRSAILLSARAHLEGGEPFVAFDEIRPLLGKGDYGTDLYHLLARTLAETKRTVAARLEFERVLRSDPGNTAARLDYAALLLHEGAVDAASREIDALPARVRTSARADLLRAYTFLARGRAKEAETSLERLLAKEPSSPSVIKALGDAKQLQGETAAAVRCYRQARSQSPKFHAAVLAEAYAIRSSRGAEAASDFLEKEIAAGGGDPVLFNLLAEIHLQAGRTEIAIQTVKRSLMVAPGYAPTHLLRARLFEAEGQLERAKAEFEETVRLDPYDPAYANALAALYMNSGELKKAEAALVALLTKNPGEPLACNNLAVVLLRGGRTAEAFQFARAAYRRRPDDPHVADTLGWALHLLGKRTEAAKLLERAKSAFPLSPEILFHWGRHLKDGGHEAEARQYFRKVVSLAPSSSAGRQAEEELRSGAREGT